MFSGFWQSTGIVSPFTHGLCDIAKLPKLVVACSVQLGAKHMSSYRH